MIPNLIYNIGSGILRAIGDAKRPLYFLIFSCGVNIVLDILFVAVFRWEVMGVAVATVLSQTASAIMVLFVPVSYTHLKPSDSKDSMPRMCLKSLLII